MPALISKFAPIAIVLALVGLSHWFAYNRGEAHATTEYELKLQELRAASAMAQAKLERRARDVERDAAAAVSAESLKHAEEARYAQREIDSLRADLRTSRVRLSIPVTSCAPGSAAGPDPATAGGPGTEARAELMPETAADLVAIAADGDAAVRQLNRLIDAYNALRERYNSMTAEGS